MPICVIIARLIHETHLLVELFSFFFSSVAHWDINLAYPQCEILVGTLAISRAAPTYNFEVGNGW